MNEIIISREALESIARERKHQDEKWGGPAHDDTHDDRDWLWIINRLWFNRTDSMAPVVRAHAIINPFLRAVAIRRILTKLAAISIAGIEAIDRRWPKAHEAQHSNDKESQR